jgi:protein with PEP-CTERM/exosortase system signal
MNKIKYIAAALVAIAGLGLQQAKADSITFNLTTSNIGFSGNLISVTVNRTSTTSATITFNSLTSGGHTFLMQGSNGAAGVNVNASSFAIGGFSFVSASTVYPAGGFQPQGGLSDGGAGNEDGFGSFNQTVNATDGTAQAMTQLSFTLTNISGTWATASAVLTGNAQGFLAAAHIVPFNSNDVVNGHELVPPGTGYAAGNGTSTSVPDGGATVMLLGVAFGALGMARRFLKI